MPVIRVSDAIFIDLKLISTWLETKTPSETIVRLVREKMEELDLERDDAPPGAVASETKDDEMEFRAAPGLSFTRLLDASVNGKALQNSNWARVLVQVISAMKRKTGLNSKALSQELQIASKPHEYNADGYRYHPELGVSIQGQSAPDAWREISRLADKYCLPIEVRFQWRQNDKAHYPGRIGILRAGQ